MEKVDGCWLIVVGETFIWRNLVHNIITFVHLDMKDILKTDDLYLLVQVFYQKLLADKSISYIFTDVVKIKLEEHLPILVTFWSQAIFNTGGYFKNLTQIHLDISEKEYLTPELFAIWLKHFNAAVDENFIGTNSEKIKTQALSLATVMQIKINLNGKKLDN